MTDPIPPPPAAGTPVLRKVIIWLLCAGFFFVGILFVRSALEHSAVQRESNAAKQRRLDITAKQRPYLEAATANRSALLDRMNAERPSRVAHIAARTGLPAKFVEDHLGWFTGTDQSAQVHRLPPDGIDWDSWRIFQGVVIIRSKELFPPQEKQFSFGSRPDISEEYLSMTTDRAVAMLMSTSPSSAVRNGNPKPVETKYDESKGGVDPVAQEIAERRKMAPIIPFAWLIEREHKSSQEVSLGRSIGKVIDFVSGAADRRIEYMIKDLPPVVPVTSANERK